MTARCQQCIRVGGSLALLLHLPLSVAANEAEVLVGKIAEAARTLNYDGDFVYLRESNVDAMRIIHQAQNGTESERLVSLSGSAREVVRNGARITCTFKNDKSVMIEQRESRNFVGIDLSQPIEQVAHFYEFARTGTDRIAGRAVTEVTIKPRSPDRYSYHLWIDEASNLLLKSTVQAPDGSPLEQVMFTRIAIGAPIDITALTPELDGAGYTSYSNEDAPAGPETADIDQVVVGWLPPGFAMKNSHTQHMASTKMPVRHMAYSDGLAMVSVFVEKMMDTVPPMQGYSALGAVHAFSRVANDFQITVIGEVPSMMVRQIAASVSINKPN